MWLAYMNDLDESIHVTALYDLCSMYFLCLEDGKSWEADSKKVRYNVG